MAEKKSTYNATKYKNNRAYDNKVYKFINLKLRKDDDQKILEAFEEAKQHGISHRQVLNDWYNGVQSTNAKTADNSGHTIESDVIPILESLTGVNPENKARASEIAEKVQSDLRYKNIVRELTESEV